MTEKNRKTEILEQSFDEIIKMSMEMEENDRKEFFSDEIVETTAFPPPPADMLDRILKACEEDKTEAKPEAPTAKPKRFKFKRILIIAAALIALLSAASVLGDKNYIFKTENRITKNSIQFSGVNENAHSFSPDEEKAYETAENALGVSVLKPTYLPEGFKLDRFKQYEVDKVIIVYRNSDKIIKISQELLYHDGNIIYTGEAVDTIEGNTYTINAQNTVITIGEYKQKETETIWLSAVWDDKQLSYKVEGSCTKEEFEKFIINLK